MFRKLKHIHFVGIGGIGMSGLAEILLTQGFIVSGSDLADSDIVQRLKQRGAQITIGHHENNIGNADVVVYSSAVDPSTNPEIIAAKQRKIPIIRRAELLAEVSRLKHTIAVAGTHGKTTTTSMIGLILLTADWDPTIIVGGRTRNFGNTNARLGNGDWIVVEADEYDRSFLKLTPEIAVVTSVDEEHVDIYPTIGELHAAFIDFANKVPFYGSVVACIDDPGVVSLLPKIDKHVITYGTVRQAKLQARNIQYQGQTTHFTLVSEEETIGDLRLNVPGLHNVQNALAATAVALELGIPFEIIQLAFKNYTGVARRIEYKGTFHSLPVYDDYAHHPTEVKATLSALRQLHPDARIICIFQPHTYTRTKRFFAEFAQSLLDADVVLLTEIYPAREAPIPNVSSSLILEAAKQIGHKNIELISDFSEIYEKLQKIAQPNDVIITIGAGSIWKLADFLTAEEQIEQRQTTPL